MIIRNGRQLDTTQEQIDAFIDGVSHSHQVCSFTEPYEGNLISNESGVPEAVYVLIMVNDVTCVQTVGVSEHYIIPDDVDAIVQMRVNAIIDNLLYEAYGIPLEEVKSPQERIDQLENESAILAMELIDTKIALEQTQNEQASLLLALIDGGVL